jgi:phosphoglycolate phosphatase
VIWDFNGTLIDDLKLVVHIVNTQLTKRDLTPLTESDYRAVFSFPVEEYYRRIGITFETETMVDLSADFFTDYAPALKNCPLHDGAMDSLRQIKTRGMRQFILSAMEERMLRSMIQHLGIERFSDGTYGLAHQEGDSKISRGHDLLRDFAIDPCMALLIGDTNHDAEVAEALGLSVALVSTGHQSRQRLQETGYPVYASLQELVQTVFPSR